MRRSTDTKKVSRSRCRIDRCRPESWGAGAGTGRVLETSFMKQTRPKVKRVC